MIGMFESAIMSLVLPMLTLNVALRAGSSKQGNAFRALVGSN